MHISVVTINKKSVSIEGHSIYPDDDEHSEHNEQHNEDWHIDDNDENNEHKEQFHEDWHNNWNKNSSASIVLMFSLWYKTISPFEKNDLSIISN